MILGPFEIDPQVVGRVSLRLTSVTLEVAVAKILRQVQGTFEVKNGVYRVVPAPGAHPFKGAVYRKIQKGGDVDR